jgi:uncharacterized protein with HEPN domain
MDHDPRAWLWDAGKAADTIAEFTEGRNFTDYLANAMLRAAAERQFEIIGEALNQLSKEAPHLAARVPHLRRAVAMRNVLIHAHRRVDNGAVWETAQDNLPELRAQWDANLRPKLDAIGTGVAFLELHLSHHIDALEAALPALPPRHKNDDNPVTEPPLRRRIGG